MRSIETAAVQAKVAGWLEHNIPDTNLPERALALAEETGEVCRCIVKMRPHVDRPFRGTREEWMVKLEEELGDVFNTLIATCVVAGFNWGDVLLDGLEKLDGIDLVSDPMQHGLDTKG